MARWPGLIERQLVNALIKKCETSGHFSKDSPEQLWVWQGQRRVSIKDALGLDLPTVYGSRKSRVILGHPAKPTAGQVWHIETEPDVLAELHVRSSEPVPGQPTAYILQLSQTADYDLQGKFTQTVSELGLVGVSAPMRGAETPGGMAELAEIYLGLGRCYAGGQVTDLLRMTDHLENQFEIEGEPIVLVLSGMGIPIGLAFAAIDQRVSAVIVDFRDAPKSITTPVGGPPMFINQYVNLGPNPLLVLAQCCAPRPMTVVGTPPDAQTPWLANPKSGVIPFTEQLTHLQAAYQASGNPERLKIIRYDKPEPSIVDLIRQTLEPFYSSKE